MELPVRVVLARVAESAAEHAYGRPAHGAPWFHKRRPTMRDVPRLKDIMTPFPYSVDAEAPIEQAIEFLRTH